ncbi:MAG TPA: cytochrome c oxidase subunit 3 [Polyangiaceae bacterium]|nr:cytochrome c oxidase subunit 3 [Polyangiaceae bacterium]
MDTPEPEPQPEAAPDPMRSVSAASLALTILMASMTMLFGASVVGYAITRAQNPVWRVEGMPGLPWGLLLSTLLIALVSFAFHRAVRAVKMNHIEALERWLWIAGGAALAFLVAQALNWRVMMTAEASVATRTLYAFTFYMLTGLHAAHVAGGFVPLGIVMRKARTREYSSSRFEGVRLCRRYWDFLGLVWLVLLLVMFLGS